MTGQLLAPLTSCFNGFWSAVISDSFKSDHAAFCRFASSRWWSCGIRTYVDISALAGFKFHGANFFAMLCWTQAAMFCYIICYIIVVHFCSVYQYLRSAHVCLLLPQHLIRSTQSEIRSLNFNCFASLPRNNLNKRVVLLCRQLTFSSDSIYHRKLW